MKKTTLKTYHKKLKLNYLQSPIFAQMFDRSAIFAHIFDRSLGAAATPGPAASSSGSTTSSGSPAPREPANW
jgi:hypothetical protein